MSLSCILTENLLLSAFMFAPMDVAQVCVEKALSSEAFVDAPNGVLYKVLLGIACDGRPVQRYVIAQKLEQDGLLGAAGGHDKLAALIHAGGLPTMAGEYIDTIKDKHRRRVLLAALGAAYSEVQEITESTDAIESRLRAVLDAPCGNGSIAMPTPREMSIEAMKRAEADTAISTGFRCIDGTAGPIYRGDKLVIAGQPKAGKSFLAANIALGIAKNHPVIVFSAEMSRTEIWKRAVCAEANVPANFWKPDHPSSLEDQNRINSAIARLSPLKMTIVDEVIDIEQALGLARVFAQRSGGLGAFVVDYVQLFSTNSLHRPNTTQVVAHVSRAIKRAATALRCVAISISQLNDDGRSLDSRGLERDCNMMLTVERKDDTGDRVVTCAYNRNGPMGFVMPLEADLYRCRFTNR